MKVQLDYTLTDPQQRNELVKKICDADVNGELTSAQLENMANYLVISAEKEERRKREILNDNRLATITTNETSFEGLISKFEAGEDALYPKMKNDKNIILSPKPKITKKDIEEIPGLKELREDIMKLKALPEKNWVIHQMIIDASKTQYIIKNAYRKPVNIHDMGCLYKPDYDYEALGLNFQNPEHIKAILKNYTSLKTAKSEDIESNIYWILIDFERLADDALKIKEPMLYEVMCARLDGMTNDQVQDVLQEKFGQKYSLEYISVLFNKTIPKVIAEEASKQHLIWYYTHIEKGNWKTCTRCGCRKLLHPLFYCRNKSSSTGFYSICKECRNKKRNKSK